MRTGSAHAETAAFLATVRRRLWARRVADVALAAAWTAAVIVVAGGILVHLGSVACPVRWRLTAGATAFVLAVVFGLAFRRPSTREAAARADAWFAAKDLMISAWDQLRRPPSERAPAADFVLARADGIAAAWRADVRRRSPSLRLGRYYAPGALLVMSAFLDVAMRGPASSPALGPAGVAVPPSRRAVAEPTNDAHGILTWRLAASSLGTAAPASDRDGTRTNGGRGDVPMADRVAPAEAAGKGSSSAGAAPALEGPGGTHAGDARPRDEGAHGVRGEQDLRVERVDVPRAAGDQATGEAVELGPGSGRVASTAANAPPPPARVVDVPLRSVGAPAQRAYVAAYLRGIGEDR